MTHAIPMELYNPAVSMRRKKEVADRTANEIRIGDDKYQMPDSIKGDPIAMSEWNRIISTYKKAKLKITSSSDVNIIARYCLLHSKYIDAVEAQKEIPEHLMFEGVDRYGNKRIEETVEYLEWKKLHSTMLELSEALLKIEDKLFLNPLAKFKHIPMIVKKDRKQEQLEQLGFGKV